ncbi:MAG: AbiV family abortive infection protein [Candidatus Eisenbacteria bacterium]|nr:AbiV family abortive infection protein [Candidatus Eisenbacteria bacterium]
MKGSIRLSRDQVRRAIRLCIRNARGLKADAEFLFEARRWRYVPILWQASLEEVGKAAMLWDKSSFGLQDLTLSFRDERDHPGKAHWAIKQASLGVNQAVAHMMRYGTDERGRRIARSKRVEELRRLRRALKRGHEIRLQSAYVGFDPRTGQPRVGHRLKFMGLRVRFGVLERLTDDLDDEVRVLGPRILRIVREGRDGPAWKDYIRLMAVSEKRREAARRRRPKTESDKEAIRRATEWIRKKYPQL